MKTAVRYYSGSGNTKALADAIADAAGVKAVSVDSPEAAINEPVDILFVGGALYAYGLDGHMKAWLKILKKENVKKAAVFSTSWISKHSLDLLKKGLAEAGIPVEGETFYVKNRPDAQQLKAAEKFAKKHI